jgi:DivIVA domain-containing protein
LGSTQQRDTIGAVVTFLTYLFGLVVACGLLFLVASFAFGRGEELAPMPADGTPVELPEQRPVRGGDVRALRLSVVLRGYRMAEVDWVLDHLAGQLDERDQEIARLRAAASGVPPAARLETGRSGGPPDADVLS